MKTCVLWMMAALALIGAGCGGYSPELAADRCDQELVKDCVTEEAYQACIECYETCGNQCQPQDTCPEQYLCE